MRFVISSLVIIFSLLIWSCESGPKIIEAQADTNRESAPPISDNPHNHAMTGMGDDVMHQVVAQEVLDTDKYSYIRVTEGDEEFWIAIGKRPIEIGATYYYKGGLLKKNFQSREFNRIFETVYLVSNLMSRPAGTPGSGSAVDQALNRLNGGSETASAEISPDEIQPAADAIPIGELLKNKAKFAGKKIKVTGKCVKVNPMIMGRNWIHLVDASVKEGDLTITTQEAIPTGAVVSVEGTIALDKDFGAGYRYDIIMEDAELK